MGIKSYQTISELLNEIGSKIEHLKQGELNLEELQNATEKSRELYERLVVIRHKAMEDLVGGTVVQIEKEEEISKEVLEEVIEAEPEAVVEEVPEEEPEEEVSFDMSAQEEKAVEEQPAFDFTFEASIEETVEEPVIEESTPEVPISASLEEDETLKEKLGGDDPLSLRKKLQSTPIEDLTKEISIARKFELIEQMFGGDSAAYEEGINALNNCGGADEAKSKLAEYSTNYKWDMENKVIIKFVELVERRYL